MSRQPLANHRSLVGVSHISLLPERFNIDNYSVDHLTREQRQKVRVAGASDKVLGELALAEAYAQFRVDNGRLSPEEDPYALVEGAVADYDRRLAELAVVGEVRFGKVA